jgi:hypothetical protein
MVQNDILLNGSIATWRMPLMIGELGGSYLGTFEFRTFLDPLRQLQAGREYRELLGSLAIQAEDNESNLAFALVQLKHRILRAPPFWSSTEQESGIPGNIGDMNVISAVLDAAMMAETMFREKMMEERNKILEKTIKVGEQIVEKRAKENGTL